MKRIIVAIEVFVFISISSLNLQVSKQDLIKIDGTVKKAFEVFKPTGLAVISISGTWISGKSKLKG